MTSLGVQQNCTIHLESRLTHNAVIVNILGKERQLETKTVESSLNDYRQSVQFANYKLCIKCQSNYTEFGAVEIKPGTDMFEQENLQMKEKKHMRRIDKYWACLDCFQLILDLPMVQVAPREAPCLS